MSALIPIEDSAVAGIWRAIVSGDWSSVDEADVAAISPSNADRPYAAWKARQADPMVVEVVELIAHSDGRRRALISIQPSFNIAAGETLIDSRPI